MHVANVAVKCGKLLLYSRKPPPRENAFLIVGSRGAFAGWYISALAAKLPPHPHLLPGLPHVSNDRRHPSIAHPPCSARYQITSTNGGMVFCELRVMPVRRISSPHT